MRRRWMLALAVALLTAGCLANVRDRATATAFLDLADEQAQSWNEEAQLVAVFGLETNQTGASDGEANASDPYDQLARFPDGNVGDGETPGWAYLYEAGNTTYAIAISANGTVIAQQEDEDGEADETPITGLEIDSDEAADVVAENNETWAQAGDGQATAWYALGQSNATADPTWILGLQRADRATTIFTVNATTGAYLGARTFDFPGWGPSGSPGSGEPYAEGGTFEDSVSAVEPTNEHAFQIQQADHPALDVEFNLDGPAASNVELTVEGPNGTLGTLEASPASPNAEASWPNPPPGGYTLTVEMTQGVNQDYRIQWCAQGSSYNVPDSPYGPGRISPCEPYYSPGTTASSTGAHPLAAP